MNLRHALLAATAVPIFLAACSSTPPSAAPTSVLAKPAAPATPVAAPKPTTAGGVAGSVLPAYLDAQSLLSRERSVYFGYDDDAVTSQYTPLIERHGKFLAEHPGVAIRIEGNTDERGSAEYNLALGQRRAEAVLRALQLYGMRGTQMEAVSYGEEKPKATGHDESTWSQNRRADLAYPSK
jgi:peptidoglycan-associated lipoprotein